VWKPSHISGFSEKSLKKGWISAQMRMDDLECNDAVQLLVKRFVNCSHASLGDELLHFIFSRVDDARHIG
jgi:hypothetical protein